jgi:asparagine synthetase B (glutamine-hydrolysing)
VSDQDVVRFGSEIKALLADLAQYRRLSAEGVHRFLARGYSGPTSTTLEGIQQVPPGTVMTFTSREQSSRARPMAAEQRRDLLEIMEDRHARGSTVVTRSSIGRAPRRRASLVEEDSTRRVVD